MFYYLSEYTEWFSPLRVFQYTTFRAVFAAITALLICIAAGPWLIRQLVGMKFQQPIRGADDLRELAQTHGRKSCPTMGGILIIWAVVDSILLWARPTNQLVLVCLVTLIWLGCVGFLDDWAKVQARQSAGLRAKTKFLFQIGLGLFVGVLLMADPQLGPTARRLMVPFVKAPVIADMGVWTLAVVVIVIVGASNAVNLTDGLDGLAAGCTLTVALAYAVMCYVAGNIKFASYLQVPAVPGAAELTVVCAALIGASLGFLWFNCHPAQVFMGDTGSLAIGGLIGAIAVMIKQELVLVIVGGIFVMEALSVIMQVASFKLRGKRVFAMAPLHHHFELRGWSETTVTTRFWVLSVIFALLGLATLKLR
ncbi:MAG TPA: phospho-N-acetylmuramoyl-pentapeptide-transferase [Verrucomicrobiae bacterium]|nr:phospho-N-acetylmuramoyl-pentapeptide-transferase [Verrucomicrobiae bacterium]